MLDCYRVTSRQLRRPDTGEPTPRCLAGTRPDEARDIVRARRR